MNTSIEAFDAFFKDMLEFVRCLVQTECTDALVERLHHLINDLLDPECPGSVVEYAESQIQNVCLHSPACSASLLFFFFFFLFLVHCWYRG